MRACKDSEMRRRISVLNPTEETSVWKGGVTVSEVGNGVGKNNIKNKGVRFFLLTPRNHMASPTGFEPVLPA